MEAITRRGLLTTGGAVALGVRGPLAGTARAQNSAEGWRPNQAVRIIVPAAAGGTTDIMGRLLAAHLQSRWGQPAVVDNRSGAGGTLGTAEAVRARPDGHTILLGNIGPQAIAYSLFRNLPYRAEQLIPVSNMILGPNVLVVHPSVPARTADEFLRLLRANPQGFSYGTPGLGQSPHLSAVWYHQLTGTRGTAVHYRGAGPAIISLIGGDIQYMFDNLTSAVEQVRAGKVRALGVTSAQRNPQLPDLPALRETAPELANYDVNTWFGAFYPAGVPEAAVGALSAEVQALVGSPETQRRFAEMGGVPVAGPPPEFARFVQSETTKWAEVLRREGLQMDAG